MDPRFATDERWRAEVKRGLKRCGDASYRAARSQGTALQYYAVGGFANLGIMYAAPGAAPALERWQGAIALEPENGVFGDQGPFNALLRNSSDNGDVMLLEPQFNVRTVDVPNFYNWTERLTVCDQGRVRWDGHPAVFVHTHLAS
eukprot:gene51795-16090_t